MIINVTKNHIKFGTRFSARNCPIALAMMDANLINPSAGYKHIFFSTNCRRHRRPTPAEVNKFIEHFDKGLKVEPFSFKLRD